MKFLRSKRGVIAVVAILLALFLFRPGISRLRNRTTRAIGASLGRRVVLNNVRVHLLPRPGFDLEGLVIYDDPSFGAEPFMRAEEVSGAIRLSSLLRGRLEFATLSATEPSINLVRDQEGHWNLGALLQRAARTAAAPTAKPAFERRPAFPYLEATRARINFKVGPEKKSYALSDATLALWQDSDNTWGARLEAQPVRTDFNLTDTGVVHVNATWGRAGQIEDTPLVVNAQWERGQLGQITKLLTGRDRGWRGGVNVTANLTGTLQGTLVRTQIRIDDFHRYDIISGENVRLAAACSGRYSTESSSLNDIFCESPVGNGTVRVRGSLGVNEAAREYDLTLTTEKVPISSVLRLARQAKKDLSPDLVADGVLNAEFRAQRVGGVLQVSGEGAASKVTLASADGKDEVSIKNVPLNVVNVSPEKKSAARTANASVGEQYLKIGPFLLDTSATSLSAEAQLSASAYRLNIRGDSSLRSLFRLGDLLGVPGWRPPAEGGAHVDLSLSGNWQGLSAPLVTGVAQLRNVHAEMPGLNTPVEISAANVVLDPDTVLAQKISLRTGDTSWTGMIESPRRCGNACRFQVDLSADQLSTADLDQWFKPHLTKRPWYRILSPSAREAKSPLLTLRTAGTLRVSRLKLRKAVAGQVTTQFDLNQGKMNLTGLRGQVFHGTHSGNWIIDLNGLTPSYQLAGRLQRVSLAEVSVLMNDGWITGSADSRYELTGSGATIPDLLSHLEGTLQFSLQNGTLPHIEMAGTARPFPVHLFSGELRLKKTGWELRAGKLESHDGIYQISGTASPSGGMDLVLVRGDELRWNLRGTLTKPQITSIERTQAKTAMKP